MKRILAPEEIPADVIKKVEVWQAKRRDFEPAHHAAALYAIFQAVLAIPEAAWDDYRSLQPILMRFPRDGSGLYSKANLVAGYHHLVAEGDLARDPLLERRIRMKPMRTLSGAGVGDARVIFNFQRENAPLKRTPTLDEVGGSALYLLSPMSGAVTGEVHFVDCGYNTVSMPSLQHLKELDVEGKAPDKGRSPSEAAE